MSRKFFVNLLAIFAVTALGVSSSSALAAESLREEKGAAGTAPVGTNFAMYNLGVATLVAPPLTVTCTKSTIGGTATTVANAPVLTVQSVTFGGCTEAAGNQVIVKTQTTTPWKLTWTAAKTFNLTAIMAEIEVRGSGKPCKVETPAAPEVFKTTWTNVEIGLGLAEISAKEALVKVSGTGCPTEGKETVTYKFTPETIGDITEKFWLS